jgi:hypothetical protein
MLLLAVVDSAVLKTPFGAATVGTEQFVTVENKELRLKAVYQRRPHLLGRVKKLQNVS